MEKSKTIRFMFISLVVVASAQNALAQGSRQSVVKDETVKSKTIGEDIIGIIPQLGMVGYTASDDAYKARAATGFGLDVNIVPMVSEMHDVYAGISTGALYSHLGSANANFFGSESTTGGGTAGANAVIVPADLKLGYNFNDRLRASIRGGGNVVYRSMANAMKLDSQRAGNDSVWSINPNVGADLEWQVSRFLNVIARPDLTIVAGNTLFMGTVGLSITPSY